MDDPIQACLTSLIPVVTPLLAVATRDVPAADLVCREESAPELCKDPLVSVFIRAYNSGDAIAKCLESILTQETDFPFEVIVSDDGSTDDTLAICRECLTRFPDKMRILIAEHNGGLTVNAARAQAHVRGRWIAECDHDDWWLDPHKLQKQLDACRRYDAIFCVTAYLLKDTQTQRLCCSRLSEKPIIDPCDLFWLNCQTNVHFYSKAIYDRVAREFPLPMEGDSFKPYCIAAQGKTVFLKDITAIHHLGNGYSAMSETRSALYNLTNYLRFVQCAPKRFHRLFASEALKLIRRFFDARYGLELPATTPPSLLRAAAVRLALRFPTPSNLHKLVKILRLARAR